MKKAFTPELLGEIGFFNGQWILHNSSGKFLQLLYATKTIGQINLKTNQDSVLHAGRQSYMVYRNLSDTPLRSSFRQFYNYSSTHKPRSSAIPTTMNLCEMAFHLLSSKLISAGRLGLLNSRVHSGQSYYLNSAMREASFIGLV